MTHPYATQRSPRSPNPLQSDSTAGITGIVGSGEGVAVLSTLDEELNHQSVPEEYHDVATHQRATLAYGIAAHEFALQSLVGQYRTAEQ